MAKIQIKQIETTGLMSVVVLDSQTIAKIMRAKHNINIARKSSLYKEKEEAARFAFELIDELEAAILEEEFYKEKEPEYDNYGEREY